MTAPTLVAPALWEHPDDPEAGYVHVEDAQKCEHCLGHGEVRVSPMGAAPWDVCTLVECGPCDATGHVHAESLRPLIPAVCSICENAIPEDETLPLCTKHSRTARAYARHFPGGPESVRSWDRRLA